jgi:phenylacetate-coenzyme A ligase PaaK-like adenylate-forming protein
MSTDVLKTPFDEASEEQTLEEALDATVRCARQIAFYRRHLPEGRIGSIEEFAKIPMTSRTDLSRASGLGELILDPRQIFRSVYPFHQNVCTFPFQVVAGNKDLYIRHDRMIDILKTAGCPESGETLLLTGPPHSFFASDLCAEIFFEGHHCSIQDITGMDAAAIRDRIETFDAEMVVLCTDSRQVTLEALGDGVRAVLTFNGAYPELGRLDATVVDIYSRTEAPYLGHRLAGERFYRYDPDHFFLERAPSGNVVITNLLWEVMPLIRYRTYDTCGALDDAEGLIEVACFGEW